MKHLISFLLVLGFALLSLSHEMIEPAISKKNILTLSNPALLNDHFRASPTSSTDPASAAPADTLTEIRREKSDFLGRAAHDLKNNLMLPPNYARRLLKSIAQRKKSNPELLEQAFDIGKKYSQTIKEDGEEITEEDREGRLETIRMDFKGRVISSFGRVVSEQEREDLLLLCDLILVCRDIEYPILKYLNVKAGLRTPSMSDDLRKIYPKYFPLIVNIKERLQEIVTSHRYSEEEHERWGICLNAMEKAIDNFERILERPETATDFVDIGAQIKGLIENADSSAKVRISFLNEKGERVESLTPVFTYTDVINVGIRELVRNAVVHGKSETVDVIISYNTQGDVHIMVRDSGKGISPQSIHEVFKRGVTSAEDPTVGTGNGLADLKHEVKMAGGKIGVVSKIADLDVISESGDAELIPGEERNKLVRGTIFGFTVPMINVSNRVIQRPLLKRPLVLVFGGLKGSLHKETARLVSARLGLRYVNGGFLLRLAVSDALRNGVSAEDKEAIARHVEGFFVSGRINLLAEPIILDDLNTAESFNGDKPLRHEIKMLIDRDIRRTSLLHDVAGMPGVKHAFYQFAERLIEETIVSGDYQGVVFVTTEPNGLGAKFNAVSVIFTADAETRASRANLPVELIRYLDQYTNRGDQALAANYPGSLRINTIGLNTREVWDQFQGLLGIGNEYKNSKEIEMNL